MQQAFDFGVERVADLAGDDRFGGGSPRPAPQILPGWSSSIDLMPLIAFSIE